MKTNRSIRKTNSKQQQQPLRKKNMTSYNDSKVSSKMHTRRKVTPTPQNVPQIVSPTTPNSVWFTKGTRNLIRSRNVPPQPKIPDVITHSWAKPSPAIVACQERGNSDTVNISKWVTI